MLICWSALTASYPPPRAQRCVVEEVACASTVVGSDAVGSEAGAPNRRSLHGVGNLIGHLLRRPHARGRTSSDPPHPGGVRRSKQRSFGGTRALVALAYSRCQDVSMPTPMSSVLVPMNVLLSLVGPSPANCRAIPVGAAFTGICIHLSGARRTAISASGINYEIARLRRALVTFVHGVGPLSRGGPHALCL